MNVDLKFGFYVSQSGRGRILRSGGLKYGLNMAISIFRKKSKIILLDEATSSLDAETENKIQEAIKSLTTGRTTLVIAHRLSTIKKASHIIVMRGGRVIESGTHEELLKKSEEYGNLYRKQITR